MRNAVLLAMVFGIGACSSGATNPGDPAEEPGTTTSDEDVTEPDAGDRSPDVPEPDPDEGPVDPCATCDDGNPCTSDDCTDGECTHGWVDGCCYDDDGCEEGLSCIEHQCAWDPALCTTPMGTLPEGLVTLEHFDGEQFADITTQDWTATDAAIPIATAPIYEAVRWELEHPAKIHGFSVRFGSLPSFGGASVAAGLYPDFGYNGFDFWQKDPRWTGSHCAGNLDAEDWVTYAFEEPVEIPHPGLVYVAHRREGEDDAAWLFDLTSTAEDGSCGNFGDCRASLTFPELHQGVSGGQGFMSWNGLSFPFQYDFVVRLHLEYTDDVTPDEHVFQPVEEITGIPSRQSFGDYDGDGDDDLYGGGNKLFRNDDGVLVDVTGESGLSALGFGGSGGVWGDWDNDGCLDLFVFHESGVAGDSLVRNNCDGTFSDATEESGINDLQTYNTCEAAGYTHAPSPAAAWFDVDSDGLLDIYIANMICWTDYSYFNDQVWRNNGDNTFSEWTGTHGFKGYEDTARSSRGANPIDYDQDGHVDIFVNRYTLHENALYRNGGDGTVQSVAEQVGAAGHESVQGAYGHSIGAAWGDLDGDADFDLVVANLAHPRFFGFSDKSQVLIQQDDGTFTDIQGDFSYPMGEAGLRFSETHSIPNLGDFDHDGDLDLVITATYSGRPTDFYWGNGDGTFELDAYHSGLTLTGGWGVAHSDLDQDGDLDLATSAGVYRNEVPDTGHWIQVRAIGNVSSNRAAIGATIRITAGDQTWVRHVSGGDGQGGQNSPAAHVGLAGATTVDQIEIDFPAGETVTWEGPFDADQQLWLLEDGAVHAGWAPPGD